MKQSSTMWPKLRIRKTIKPFTGVQTSVCFPPVGRLKPVLLREVIFSRILRPLVAVLLGVIGLTFGPCWGARQAPSWAAPGQSPYAQTVPTRLLTPTLPSEPTPASEAEEEPSEDNDDASPTPLPVSLTPLRVESPIPAPTPDKLPTLAVASPAPIEPAGPPEAVADPQLDYSAATLTATILDTGEDTSLHSAPIPSRSPRVESNSTDETERSALSETLASVAVDGPEQSLESPMPSHRASPLLWLYATGLGLLLILGGAFLINRS